MHVCVFVNVSVCVCEREKERERQRWPIVSPFKMESVQQYWESGDEEEHQEETHERKGVVSRALTAAGEERQEGGVSGEPGEEK